MSIEENLKKLNIILPKANDPVGSYAATRISGNLLVQFLLPVRMFL